MFKRYGYIGILLIILCEMNFFFRVEPFINYAFIGLWIGYILVVDALVYKIRGNSLIYNRGKQFLGIVLLSGPLWLFFGLVNVFLRNWSYIGLEFFDYGSCGHLFCFYHIIALISFATVLPAFFETVELIRAVHLFDKVKLHKHYNFKKEFLHSLIAFGTISFFLILFVPKYTFPLIWLSVFLILDPINYLNKQPSIIGYIKSGKLGVPLALLLAGLIMGFFWEFWNYWAQVKWTYNVPFVGFGYIFEMPILGYLGYLPFAWELYAMYWFVRSLFDEKKSSLIK